MCPTPLYLPVAEERSVNRDHSECSIFHKQKKVRFGSKCDPHSSSAPRPNRTFKLSKPDLGGLVISLN
jgi:hypothetical protein